MPQTPPYKNSNESEWTGHASHLFSEDFEESGVANSPNGHWYGEDYDTAVSNGGIDPRTKGWGGSIFGNPITPSGAASNGDGYNSSWAGHHGDLTGAETDINLADHSLSSSSGEFHVRWYQKWESDYLFGAEKVLTFNKGPAGTGGIWWGNIHINCGFGSNSSTGTMSWQPAGVTTPAECQEIGTITRGQYMCIEIHFKKSTTRSSADGRIRVWMNACGTDGTSPPEAQTLLLDFNNINLGQSNGNGGSDSDQVGSLWFESWANPTSEGISWIDNIVVIGGDTQIGFVGAEQGGGGVNAILMAQISL